MDLPLNGKYFKSPNKKYDETVVLIHHYGGGLHSLRRHIHWLNDHGWDAVGFELSPLDVKMIRRCILSSHFNFGLVEVWADEIEMILNRVLGQKFVLSFSSPGFAAVKSIVRRNAYDIKGWVCDSGPFVGGFWHSFWNYFTYQSKIKNILLRGMATSAGTLAWGREIDRKLLEDLKKLPEGFPVLSVRGWKDQLVDPKQIENAFENQHHLDVYALPLPDAGHLNGLKDFPEEYGPKLEEFLERFSTPVTGVRAEKTTNEDTE